jgi:hypothetical protein
MDVCRWPLLFICDDDVYEKYNDMLIRSLLLFVRSDEHVKSIGSRELRRSGAPCFLYVVMHM